MNEADMIIVKNDVSRHDKSIESQGARIGSLERRNDVQDNIIKTISESVEKNGEHVESIKKTVDSQSKKIAAIVGGLVAIQVIFQLVVR